MDLEYVNLSALTDTEIAARMRLSNYEKFKTLVRMHLSFELDLNTDEFDLPCHEIVYEDKGKLKKWNRMSKKQKHVLSTGTLGCTATLKGGSASAGNSPTDGIPQHIDAGFLMHLEELKEFLLQEKNMTQEGIFRKTGSTSRQNELRQQIQQDKPLDLEAGGYSVHDCATVFKGYLAELPEPLLTDAHYPAYLQIAPLCIGSALLTPTTTITPPGTIKRPPNPERLKRDSQLLNSVQLLLLLLPQDNCQLLQHVIAILHAVAMKQELNRMSPENLATLFSPHLMCPRNLPPEALHYVAKKMSGIVAYMIIRGMEIFEVPPKLATDIRAYFLERKRKKTMSPEQTLDDSISDISTVNTIYTFVDRERTAAAHTANTTDTELAQLYAHIQSLPESSKKRRLIKQFNKQNGQGTPLQLVIMNRLRNSEASRSAKSISDSIKKHIFHKGIMSRTPKRQGVTAMPSGVETPNFSNTKNPKLRVLFQSPVPATCMNNVAITTSSMPNCTPTHTPYATIKTHPLQKSISSSSLLLNSSTTTTSSAATHPLRQLSITPYTNEEVESCSSCSSDGFPSQQKCVSAPVSRQISSDLPAATSANTTVPAFSHTDANCCAAPLKLISEAAKTLMGVSGGVGQERKTVAWDEDQLLQIEEEDELSQDATSLNQQHEPAETHELKSSRYKSEPNLSCMLREQLIANEKYAETLGHTPMPKSSKSLTRKLMKGVSMSNIKLPFSTPETTMRLVRSVSSTLKRRSFDEPNAHIHMEHTCGSRSAAVMPLLEDFDDETFEDDSEDDIDGDADLQAAMPPTASGTSSRSNSDSSELPSCSRVASARLQQSSAYRNLNLMNSTPSLLLGRRSMSPITKSTQRMPKAMQESIMTPRSRKPVMVLTTTTLSGSDQNQTICQADSSSFPEHEEINAAQQDSVSLNSFPGTPCGEHASDTEGVCAAHLAEEALTHNFKEYLLSRSVLTASPVDSSFSSQPDDFGGSTHDVEDLDESQLSRSLLYCLNGNQPDAVESEVTQSVGPLVRPLTATENRLTSNPFLMLNNARKRAATNNLDLEEAPPPSVSSASAASSTDSPLTDKENSDNLEGYHLLSKKLLISEYPGETSF